LPLPGPDASVLRHERGCGCHPLCDADFSVLIRPSRPESRLEESKEQIGESATTQSDGSLQSRRQCGRGRVGSHTAAFSGV